MATKVLSFLISSDQIEVWRQQRLFKTQVLHKNTLDLDLSKTKKQWRTTEVEEESIQQCES